MSLVINTGRANTLRNKNVSFTSKWGFKTLRAWGISNHQQPDCLFNALFRLLIRHQICGPLGPGFVRGSVHGWRVDSPNKKLVMWKAIPCYNIIICSTSHKLCNMTFWTCNWFSKVGVILDKIARRQFYARISAINMLSFLRQLPLLLTWFNFNPSKDK